MASATRKTVEKTITEDVFVLELTQEEKTHLHDLLFRGAENEPLRRIYCALETPTESEDRPIRVGEKVRIVKASQDPSYNGRIGTVGQVDKFDPDAMYKVQFPGDYEWAVTVERVND